MFDASYWRAFYLKASDGRFRITIPALRILETRHRRRIVTTVLRGRPEKVLILDVPLQLGDKIRGAVPEERYLHRVRLRDVPGWPPIFPPLSGRPHHPDLRESRLIEVRMKRRVLELDLDQRGRVVTAWIIDCPFRLLKCVECTLRQKNAAGNKLLDLQEMRLICFPAP